MQGQARFPANLTWEAAVGLKQRLVMAGVRGLVLLGNSSLASTTRCQAPWVLVYSVVENV